MQAMLLWKTRICSQGRLKQNKVKRFGCQEDRKMQGGSNCRCREPCLETRARCTAAGPGRCKINNGGCWHSTQDGQMFSACLDTQTSGCKCPPGFRGNGVDKCEDINECKEKVACQCSECSCKNTWGSYECSCKGDFLYMRDHDTCISKKAEQGKVGWAPVWIVLLGLAAAGVGAYVVYKYRLRSYMDSEIRAIMAQYMPLDSQGEIPNHVNNETL